MMSNITFNLYYEPLDENPYKNWGKREILFIDQLEPYINKLKEETLKCYHYFQSLYLQEQALWRKSFIGTNAGLKTSFTSQNLRMPVKLRAVNFEQLERLNR